MRLHPWLVAVLALLKSCWAHPSSGRGPGDTPPPPRDARGGTRGLLCFPCLAGSGKGGRDMRAAALGGRTPAQLCSSLAGLLTPPHPGLPSSPASASSLFPSNSAVALPPGSPPDQTTGGRQHIQGQTVRLPPPGDPRALLCSERASCTPALPRGPGPVLIEGPTSWGVIKVAVQTCSCKGQGGGSGRPRFPALRRPRF